MGELVKDYFFIIIISMHYFFIIINSLFVEIITVMNLVERAVSLIVKAMVK